MPLSPVTDHLPVTRADDGIRRLHPAAVVREVPEEVLARELFLAPQNPHQADTVELCARTIGLASVDDRRHEVDRAREGVEHDPCGDNARPTNEERHPNPALVGEALARTKRRVVGRAFQPAVVRREEDQRLFCDAELVKLIEDTPDALVHALDHRGVYGVVLAAPLLCAPRLDELGLRLQRSVDGIVRKLQKERAVRALSEEVDRFVSFAVSEILPLLTRLEVWDPIQLLVGEWIEVARRLSVVAAAAIDIEALAGRVVRIHP